MAKTKSTRSTLTVMLQRSPDFFKQEAAHHASNAAAPLAQWVSACGGCANVMDSVGPLEAHMHALHIQSERKQAQLTHCQQTFAQLGEKLQKLKVDLHTSTHDAAQLTFQLGALRARRGAASRLPGQVAGEKARWGAQTATRSAEGVQLLLQAHLAAALHTPRMLIRRDRAFSSAHRTSLAG